MKFSTKATYGLKAMLYLADHYGERAISASYIAKEEGMPLAYLEQILNRLKKNGWIKSIRGPKGGYVLIKRPSDINMSDLLKSLGEAIEFFSAQGGKARDRKRPVAHRASENFWQHIMQSFDSALAKISLQDLIQSVTKSSKTTHFNFSI